MPSQSKTGVFLSIGALGVLLTIVLYLIQVASNAGILQARVDALSDHEARIRACERVGDKILTRLDDVVIGQQRMERALELHVTKPEKPMAP